MIDLLETVSYVTDMSRTYQSTSNVHFTSGDGTTHQGLSYYSMLSALGVLFGSIGIITNISTICVGLSALLGSINTTLQVIATAVHLKTLLSVHRIAFFVSEDYRKYMKKFYKGLTKVSKALGYKAYDLAIIFRASKNLIMSTSATLGLTPDEANLIWLGRLDNYLVQFAKKCDRYHDDPEELFNDMDQWFIDGESRKSGKFMATISLGLTNALSIMDATIKDVIVVRNDLEDLIVSLPDRIESQVRDVTGDILGKFDTFIDSKYNPAIANIGEALGVFGLKLDKESENVFHLTSRLLKPVDYLLEIDGMTDAEKAEQEEKFNELITRSLTEETDSVVEVASPTAMELSLIAEAGIIPTVLPPWSVPEIETPSTPAGEEPEERETWFVGDY